MQSAGVVFIASNVSYFITRFVGPRKGICAVIRHMAHFYDSGFAYFNVMGNKHIQHTHKQYNCTISSTDLLLLQMQPGPHAKLSYSQRIKCLKNQLLVLHILAH